MRHNVSGRKLNRNASHRNMMFRNMVTELFRHGRIKTTTVKAKEARSLAERLITYAKAGDLNSRRMAARKLLDPEILQKLFDEIGPRYADRPGGYTRVLKIDGGRKGDNAEMAFLELVGNDEGREKSQGRAARKPARLKDAPAAAAAPEPAPEPEPETAEAAPAEEAPAEEAPADGETTDEPDKSDA